MSDDALYELRSITADEVPAFRTAVSQGFGNDANDAGNDRFLSLMPLDRTVGAIDGGQFVGTLGDFPMVLTVPGGNQVSMAATTMVTVRATHTRRGILRSMVRRHLDNAVSRGDAVAGLWASEAGIYERFGFGLSLECHIVNIDARRLDVPAVGDDLRISMVRPDDVVDVVAPFWSKIARQRAGFLERSPERWQDIVNDHEYMRDGSSEHRHVVARRAGEVVGYLDYQQAGKWNDMVPDGTVIISTLFGADNEAQRAMWAYALDIDLFPHLHFWNGAVDDTLAYEVSNARSVKRTMCDGLYVRILDVVAALHSRSYEADGQITIELDDDMGYAGGTYEVSIVGGQASVTSSTAAPDVAMSVRDLGAIFLGRNCVDLYAATGRLRGADDKLRLLGQLFATARAPWCPEMF